jgi:hypothetical protein
VSDFPLKPSVMSRRIVENPDDPWVGLSEGGQCGILLSDDEARSVPPDCPCRPALKGGVSQGDKPCVREANSADDLANNLIRLPGSMDVTGV